MFSAQDVKTLREKTGAGMLDCKKALESSNGNMDNAVVWLREKGIAKAAKKSERIAAEGLSKISVEGDKAVILEVNSETDFVAKNDEFKNFVESLSQALLKSNAKTMEEALQVDMNGQSVADAITAITSKIGEKISFRRFASLEKTATQHFGDYTHMGGKIAVLALVEGADNEVAKDVAMHACAMRPTYIDKSDVPEDVLEQEKTIFKEQAINEGKSQEIAEKMVQGRISKYYKEVCLKDQPFIKDQNVSVSDYVKSHQGEILNMIRFEVGEGLEKRNENFAEEVQNQING